MPKLKAKGQKATCTINAVKEKKPRGRPKGSSSKAVSVKKRGRPKGRPKGTLNTRVTAKTQPKQAFTLPELFNNQPFSLMSLAIKTGVHISTIYRISRGESNVNILTLERICKGLGYEHIIGKSGAGYFKILKGAK